MTCYSSILLLFLLQESIPVQSELAITGSGTYQIAVGATALYSANYSRESTSGTEILYWRLNAVNKVQVFIAGDGTLTIFNLGDARFQASHFFTASVYILSLKITPIQLTDSGVVDIFRDLLTSGLLNTFGSLNVQECDSTSEGDKANIIIEELVSSTYNGKVNVSCSDGYTADLGVVTMTCLENATWSRLGACSEATTALVEIKTTSGTDDTTTSGANSSNAEPGGLLLGAIAAIVIGGILVVLLIIHLSLGVFVGLDVVKTLLSTLIIGGLYVLGSVLSIIGIIMCSSGNLESTADYMNGVEKAGTALGTIGLVIIIAALIKAAVTGGSKGTTKQIPDATHMDATSKEPH